MQRIKLELKYTFTCDPGDLYHALSKPAVLQNWICDDVDFVPGTGIYTFFWGDYSESAKLVESKKNEFLKWEWVDADDRGDHDYLSFRIVEEDPEEGICDLYIEDFCDVGQDQQLTQGWDKQMEDLNKLVR